MNKKTNVEALRLQLMAAMERINHDNDGAEPLTDDQMRLEIEKAKAVSMLAENVIDLAKVEVMHEAILLKQKQLESAGKLESLDRPIHSHVGFFALSE